MLLAGIVSHHIPMFIWSKNHRRGSLIHNDCMAIIFSSPYIAYPIVITLYTYTYITYYIIYYIIIYYILHIILYYIILYYIILYYIILYYIYIYICIVFYYTLSLQPLRPHVHWIEKPLSHSEIVTQNLDGEHSRAGHPEVGHFLVSGHVETDT